MKSRIFFLLGKKWLKILKKETIFTFSKLLFIQHQFFGILLTSFRKIILLLTKYWAVYSKSKYMVCRWNKLPIFARKSCKIRDFAVKCHYKKPFIWIVVKFPPADFQWGLYSRGSGIAKRLTPRLKTYGQYFAIFWLRHHYKIPLDASCCSAPNSRFL